jgi:hypothetical protein
VFLLDTNVVSELRRLRPHGAVLAWVERTPPSSLYLSAVTVGEIQLGVEITRDHDPVKAAEIERWLEKITQTLHVLHLDAASFRIWARLMHGASEDHALDAMIAAVAIARDMTVVTRNVRHFKAFGVGVKNPFVAA